MYSYTFVIKWCVAHFSLKGKPKKKGGVIMKSVLIALIKAMFGGFAINTGDISFNKIIIKK